MTKEQYERLKYEYQAAGRKAAGKPANHPARQKYLEAKHRYHRAGEELRRERNGG